MASIPPPPPLPPGTVVPRDRLSPPPMPRGLGAGSIGRGLGSPSNGGISSPAAVGNGLQQRSPAHGAVGVPVPPPLPPGTVVPQNRPIPPPMPPVAGLQPAQSAVANLPQPPRKVLERPANGKDIQFPAKVKYFESAEDIRGEKEKGILRLRVGQMVAVYKTEDPDWWLGKVSDDVGWISAHSLQELDPQAAGKQKEAVAEEANPRRWDSKKEGQMTAGEMDMDKTDFGYTQATTFDHYGSKITAFFIQVSGVRRNVKMQGDIWVVAKTLKAFNRLRVAWEEDYGYTTIPVEPPPARWATCSEADWTIVKGAALRKFLEEVKQWPNLKHSQDLKHFLTTDRVNLTGGMISKKTMKPYLDAWVKTSAEPSWTLPLPPIPSKDSSTLPGAKATLKVDKEKKKAAIPGLRAGDESFGKLTSRRPKLRRSNVFDQISSLAAVTRQDAQLETGRRGWTTDGIKLQLLTLGGDAFSLKKRSERNIFQKYYADDEYEDVHSPGTPKGNGNGVPGPGGTLGYSRVLSQRGNFNQMKFHTRRASSLGPFPYHLEKIMYGRMENLSKENGTKYAVYAKQKEQEKMQKDGNVNGTHKRGIGSTGHPAQQKKNSMFQLEALSEKLNKMTKLNEMQSKPETPLDKCQYMSKMQGRFTMPVAAQLMAMNELSRDQLDQFMKRFSGGGRPKLERMKELDNFLEDKRLRCHQLEMLMHRVQTTDEKLLVVMTCCAKLTDAVEAEELGIFAELERFIDPLNFKRAKLVVDVLVAEAHTEEASRASRKAAREVHADVQRARKALGFLSKAVEKIRSGTIKIDMFEELKDRLESAADAAYEEYCDAVKDTKPANTYAEQALSFKEEARSIYKELDALGTGVKDRVKVVLNSDGGMEPADTEESILVSALEVVLTIANNAFELATRAADNARFDMQKALEEVAKAEKIIRRVELEDRRARNECDAAEGRDQDSFHLQTLSEPSPILDMGNINRKGRNKGAPLSALSSGSRPKVLPGGEDLDMGTDCPFGEWELEMRDHTADNLEEFRKEGKYRLHLDKAVLRGTEDVMMMATLLAKVQLLRDLKILKAHAKVEEQRRQESLMQNSSKRRKRTAGRRDASGAGEAGRGVSRGVAGAGTSRHALVRQQSSLGHGGNMNPRAVPLRQQSLGPGDDEHVTRRDRGHRKTMAPPRDGRRKGRGEYDEYDEDEGFSTDGGSIGSGPGILGDDIDSEEEELESSSDADSVFGSDLDGDDEDLGSMRRKAGRRGNVGRRRSGGPAGSRGVGLSADATVSSAMYTEQGSSSEGATRRNDRMRRELIHQTLGRRRSIGTKRLAKNLVPLTPRRGGGMMGRNSSGQFEFSSHTEDDDDDDDPR